ncbi:hypothetical protein GE09DRAFT_1060904 [Coniochaeta sp. 2T2.1]|nr:hypothetical protein GE09DRAFT_1060904 [Coniochaeta sp. 2T2.1]
MAIFSVSQSLMMQNATTCGRKGKNDRGQVDKSLTQPDIPAEIRMERRLVERSLQYEIRGPGKQQNKMEDSFRVIITIRIKSGGWIRVILVESRSYRVDGDVASGVFYEPLSRIAVWTSVRQADFLRGGGRSVIVADLHPSLRPKSRTLNGRPLHHPMNSWFQPLAQLHHPVLRHQSTWWSEDDATIFIDDGTWPPKIREAGGEDY